MLTIVKKRYYFILFREWEKEKREDLVNEVVRLIDGIEIGELTIGPFLALFNFTYIIS